MKKISTLSISLILVSILIFGIIGNSYAVSSFTTKSQFNGASYTHYGDFSSAKVKDMIDVSEHNGLINFYKIKALGIDDVIIRVGFRGYGSSGSLGEDKYFYDNMENAIDAGLNIGLYFYSQALTTDEAKAEASYSVKRAAQYKEYINLPIFYDYEFAGVKDGRLDKAWSNGTINKTKMTNNAIAFCDVIKNSGYKSGVYASASFFTDQLDSSKIYNGGNEIWNAYYTKNSTSGSYWTNKNRVYKYWQYGGANVQGSCGSPDTAWLYVEYNGKKGYVLSSYVDFTGSNSGFAISDVNLRSNAGTSYSSLGIIPFAGQLKIISYPKSTNTDVNFYYYTGESSVVQLDKPSFSLSASSTSVTVSWKAVSGASYYRVYSYDKDSGKYKIISKTSELSFTQEGLNKETEYTFLVRAFASESVFSPYTKSDNKSILTAPEKPVFSLSAGTSKITVSWSEVKNAAYYNIYSYDNVNSKYTKIGQVTSTKFVYKSLQKETQYTILVRAFFSDGAGSLFTLADNKSIFTASESPVLNCDSKTASSLSLSWDKANNTQFYRLYSYTPETGKYKTLAQTDTCRYILTGLESGTEYTLLVRAFVSTASGSDYSSEDHLIAKTLPSKPDFSLKGYSDIVKISWKKVTGADFYRVYSYNKSTGKYKKLAETSECSWEHKELKGNTEYIYIVRAFINTAEGSVYSKADNKSVKTLPAKPDFSLTVKSESEIGISWTKVSGASYYKIYLYNPATKTYKTLAKTTALSYRYNKAAIGNEYIFLVRAFDSKDVGSSYTAADRKSAEVKLEKVDFYLKSEKSGSVKISWKKVDIASYYRVYSYDAEKGKYTVIAKTSALSFVKDSLESGRQYTFLVRAFVPSGAGSVYAKTDNKSILL